MKRMLWVFLMMSCGATFISSLFPLYSEYYHLSSLQITILFAIYAVFLLPTLLIVGVKGSEWGLKKVLRYSIWISIVSTIIFIISFDFWSLFTARVLEGIAYGAFTGTAIPFLIVQSPANKISTAIKLSGVTVLIGFGLGPAISGVVVEYLYSQSLSVPYWFLLVMLISSLVILETFPVHNESSIEKPIHTKISISIPSHIRSHFWSFVGLPIFIVFTLQGIAFSLLPSFAKNIIHTSNLSVSGLLILLLLGGASLSQFVPWPINIVTRIRFGISLFAIGSWAIILSGQFSNLILLWIGIFLQAIGGGWTFQVTFRLASQLPKPEERQGVISVFYLCAYTGFIVPIIGFGVLTKFFSMTYSLILLNLFAAIFIVYILMYSIKFKQYYSNHYSY
ncbi:MFS transporter (plasmid) [Bacillus sp. CMF21]|nr:MFS transporter [Bacillus sp. CMF21]